MLESVLAKAERYPSLEEDNAVAARYAKARGHKIIWNQRVEEFKCQTCEARFYAYIAMDGTSKPIQIPPPKGSVYVFCPKRQGDVFHDE